MEEYEIACCVCGYHVYREIWEAAVGETLVCEREPQNGKDRYAVAVKKNETIVGHLWSMRVIRTYFSTFKYYFCILCITFDLYFIMI